MNRIKPGLSVVCTTENGWSIWMSNYKTLNLDKSGVLHGEVETVVAIKNIEKILPGLKTNVQKRAKNRLTMMYKRDLLIQKKQLTTF